MKVANAIELRNQEIPQSGDGKNLVIAALLYIATTLYHYIYSILEVVIGKNKMVEKFVELAIALNKVIQSVAEFGIAMDQVIRNPKVLPFTTDQVIRHKKVFPFTSDQVIRHKKEFFFSPNHMIRDFRKFGIALDQVIYLDGELLGFSDQNILNNKQLNNI